MSVIVIWFRFLDHSICIFKYGYPTFQELLADFQAQETIQSLIQNTMESTNILLAKTNRVDLAKDAEDLR